MRALQHLLPVRKSLLYLTPDLGLTVWAKGARWATGWTWLWSLEISATHKTTSQQAGMQTAVSIVGTDAPFQFSTRRLLRGMVDFRCEGCYRDGIEALAGIRTIRP